MSKDDEMSKMRRIGISNIKIVGIVVQISSLLVEFIKMGSEHTKLMLARSDIVLYLFFTKLTNGTDSQLH